MDLYFSLVLLQLLVYENYCPSNRNKFMHSIFKTYSVNAKICSYGHIKLQLQIVEAHQFTPTTFHIQ